MGDTKSHSKFQPNMISSFGAILAWKSDDDDDADAAADTDADDDYDDDRKSDPYVSPSFAGDTKSTNPINLYPLKTFIFRYHANLISFVFLKLLFQLNIYNSIYFITSKTFFTSYK